MIVYLKDYQEYMTALSQWSFETWSKYDPTATRKGYIEKFKKHCHKDRLPLTLIALNDNKLMGMCSLREHDGIQTALAPWLGSLYVTPRYRGQKVAEELIDAIKQVAAEMGFDKLYLFTFEESLNGYFSKLGWSYVGLEQLNDHPVSIMVTEIDAHTRKLRQVWGCSIGSKRLPWS